MLIELLHCETSGYGPTWEKVVGSLKAALQVTANGAKRTAFWGLVLLVCVSSGLAAHRLLSTRPSTAVASVRWLEGRVRCLTVTSQRC